MKNRPAILAFLLLVLGSAAAQSSKLTFSPSPAVAGEPITATFEGVSYGCEGGTMTVGRVSGNEINLLVSPPGCPILPPFVASEYTASTTLGPLAPGIYWVLVLHADQPSTVLTQEALVVKAPPVCRTTETSLCLGGSRFEVTGEWTDFAGNQGSARVVPANLDSLGNFGALGHSDGLDNFGVLWFFDPTNPEMVVKILNGCSNNGYYWVFLSPASTVEYRITVHDVVTGQEKAYGKALNVVPRLTADTRAFPCAAP